MWFFTLAILVCLSMPNNYYSPLLAPPTRTNTPTEVPAAPVISDTPIPNPLTQLFQQGGHGLNSPSLAGAMENSPQFKKAAFKAWATAGSGMKPHTEAGFTVNDEGQTSPINENVSEGSLQVRGHLDQTVNSDTAALVHTHPLGGTQPPSPGDIGVSKHLGKPVYVINQRGLWMVVPGTGEVVQVASGLDWMTKQIK